MKLVYGLLSLLVAGFILNSCSELTSAEKYGDDIYAEVTIKMGNISLEDNRVRGYVGQVFNFSTEKDVVPSATELREKWSVEPASIAEVDEFGTVEITNLGKADLIVGLYDKKQNLVVSDTLILYADAKKTLELSGTVQTFTNNHDVKGIFLGSSGAVSILSSVDNGDNWNPVHNPISNSVIRNIARSPVNPNHLVATYRELDQCYDENCTGVLVSKDNGQSWEEVSHPYENRSGEMFNYFTDVDFDPDDSQTLYILSAIESDDGEMRLYRTTDFGISWKVLKTFDYNSSTTSGLFLYGQHTIVVASAGSVNGEKGFVSTDDGSTWNSWPSGTIETVYHMDNNGGLYARTFKGNTTSSAQQIIYSGDMGNNWEVIFEHDSHGLVHVDTYAIDNIAVLEHTGFSNGFALRISNNGGSTWKEFKSDLAGVPFIRPNKIKILDSTEDSMELLLFFGNPWLNDDQGQVWKLMVYFDSL